MVRTFIFIGSLAAALGVAFGAFGAHGLRNRLSPEMVAVFETAVRYEMYHALALLALAALMTRFDGYLFHIAGWSFTVGIVLFSGSLYALALGAPRAVGALTPIGGLAWIAAWLLFAFGVWRAGA